MSTVARWSTPKARKEIQKECLTVSWFKPKLVDIVTELWHLLRFINHTRWIICFYQEKLNKNSNHRCLAISLINKLADDKS